MSIKHFGTDFRSLLSRLVIGIAASVVITGVAAGLLHLEFWNYWWTLGVGAVLGCVLLHKLLDPLDWRFYLLGIALVALPAAGFQYTFFYTQDEAGKFESLADYDPEKDANRFVEFNNWYYSTHEMGVAEIASTEYEYRRRRQIRRTSRTSYIAIPMYAAEEDTLPKVWMALEFDTQKANSLLNSRSDNKLIRFSEICCFERVALSLSENFRYAIDECDDPELKNLRDDAVFLTPLYEPFIPRKQWLRYSIYGFLGAIGGMIVLALIVPSHIHDDDDDDDDDDDE